MLTSLVTGLREVRAPFVSGSLWLAALWLALGPGRLVPNEAGASAFERRLAALIETVGPAVTLASLAFAAVLLGDLIPFPGYRWTRWLWKGGASGVTDTLSLWADDQSAYLGKHIPWSEVMSDAAPSRMRSAVKHVAERAEDREDDDDWTLDDLDHENTIKVQKAVLQLAASHEIDLLIAQLDLGPDVPREEFRRQETEADVRLAIVTPIAAIVGIACLTWSWWCALLFLVPALLLHDGANRQRRSIVYLMSALARGHAKSPSAEYIRSLSERYSQQPEALQTTTDQEPTG